MVKELMIEKLIKILNIIMKLTVQLHVILKIEMILDTHDILSPKKFDRDRSYLSR